MSELRVAFRIAFHDGRVLELEILDSGDVTVSDGLGNVLQAVALEKARESAITILAGARDEKIDPMFARPVAAYLLGLLTLFQRLDGSFRDPREIAGGQPPAGEAAREETYTREPAPSLRAAETAPADFSGGPST